MTKKKERMNQAKREAKEKKIDPKPVLVFSF